MVADCGVFVSLFTCIFRFLVFLLFDGEVCLDMKLHDTNAELILVYPNSVKASLT